jgi:hypothetical protein
MPQIRISDACKDVVISLSNQRPRSLTCDPAVFIVEYTYCTATERMLLLLMLALPISQMEIINSRCWCLGWTLDGYHSPL